MKLRTIIILFIILVALGGYYYISRHSQPSPESEPEIFVWMIEMDDIEHVEIILTREGKGQSFVKGADRYWYFDDAQRSEVDKERWGGGIPLLLSGPKVERIVAIDATEEKLAEFGLMKPRMEINLGLKLGNKLVIRVGDATPNGMAFYIKDPDSNDVATVDITWYNVMERLVNEPPYVFN